MNFRTNDHFCKNCLIICLICSGQVLFIILSIIHLLVSASSVIQMLMIDSVSTLEEEQQFLHGRRFYSPSKSSNNFQSITTGAQQATASWMTFATQDSCVVYWQALFTLPTHQTGRDECKEDSSITLELRLQLTC